MLGQLFSSGAAELVKGVGGVIDNLHTSKEEKLEAQRKWQMDHYERNRAKILKKAKERYRLKKLEERRQEKRRKMYGEQ